MGQVRGVLQTAAGIGLTVATSGALAVMSAVTSTERRNRLAPAVMRRWGRQMLKLVGVELVVEGAEHLAGPGARVVVFNHSSMLDAFIVTALMPEASTAAVKREAAAYPVIGAAMRGIGFVLLDRAHSEVARAAMREVGDRINRERLSVWIAPEGTRSVTGDLQRFRRGAFHLAASAQTPVIMVVIEGAFELKPKHHLDTRPGTVHVRVLPPQQVTWTHETAGQAADRMHDLFEAELASMRRARQQALPVDPRAP